MGEADEEAGETRAEGPTELEAVDDFALATRLSYFLWSSMPDEVLFDVARTGRLAEPEVLEGQVRRMLRDGRASALATNFAVQWLELRNLDTAEPDIERFPEFDDALRAAMRVEGEMFFEAVLREQRDVRELLDADFTFVNGPLAAHYGIPGVKGPAFRRVQLADDRRGGVLGQAGVLTVTSNPTRTSPVKRGKWVLEHLLDAPPRPPPPGADNLDEEQVTRSAGTLRATLELHRRDPRLRRMPHAHGRAGLRARELRRRRRLARARRPGPHRRPRGAAERHHDRRAPGPARGVARRSRLPALPGDQALHLRRRTGAQRLRRAAALRPGFFAGFPGRRLPWRTSSSASSVSKRSACARHRPTAERTPPDEPRRVPPPALAPGLPRLRRGDAGAAVARRDDPGVRDTGASDARALRLRTQRHEDGRVDTREDGSRLRAALPARAPGPPPGSAARPLRAHDRRRPRARATVRATTRARRPRT